MQEAEYISVVRGREGAISLLETGEEAKLEGVANGSRARGRSDDSVGEMSRARSAGQVLRSQRASDLPTGRSLISRSRCCQGAIFKEPVLILSCCCWMAEGEDDPCCRLPDESGVTTTGG